MTWAEFKAAIEKAGVKDADMIWYIDTHPDFGFTVHRDKAHGISISD